MRFVVFITLMLSLVACNRVPCLIEPTIIEPLHPKEVARETRLPLLLPETFSVSPFPSLTPEELQTDWGKEYRLACIFADDFDLYRAITDFKRALSLIPETITDRKLEIEYCIALAYYLGKKYVETVHIVETMELALVDNTFPAFSDLLIILYDSYKKIGKQEKADHMLTLIHQYDSCNGEKLNLLSLVEKADIPTLLTYAEENPEKSYLTGIVRGYCSNAKSVRKAEVLNALLPGAGYWYVGQRQTALTALLINSLFIGAAAHFFHTGNNPAGIILLSFESGWYFGGIYGAALAAKYYNERIYEMYADKICKRENYFPIMMLKFTF